MNRLRKAGVDVHQHLWPEGLIAALRARRQPPRLRGWRLELGAEPDYRVDPDRHDVDLRAAEAVDDGLDLALVSLSAGRVIEPVQLNAVEFSRSTHPLARFLCELPTARLAFLLEDSRAADE